MGGLVMSKKMIVMLLMLSIIAFGKNDVKTKAADESIGTIAESNWQETEMGKLKSVTGTQRAGNWDVFGEKANDVGFLMEPERSTADLQFHYYSLENGKWKIKKYYAGEISEYQSKGYSVGGIRKKGKKTYVCQRTGKKKIRIIVYNNKKKVIKKKSFNVKKLLEKSVRNKKSEYIVTSNLYVTGKNKVRILYWSANGSAKKTYIGGYADLNIKTGKIVKKKRVKFLPKSWEGGYLVGEDGENYVIAKASNGKILRKISARYGEPENIDEQLREKHGEFYECSRTFDFQSGRVMFINASGVYYATAKSDKVVKIADNSELTYYQFGTASRYVKRIIMKDKSEFYISYCDGAFSDSWKEQEYLVYYKKK